MRLLNLWNSIIQQLNIKVLSMKAIILNLWYSQQIPSLVKELHDIHTTSELYDFIKEGKVFIANDDYEVKLVNESGKRYHAFRYGSLQETAEITPAPHESVFIINDKIAVKDSVSHSTTGMIVPPKHSLSSILNHKEKMLIKSRCSSWGSHIYLVEKATLFCKEKLEHILKVTYTDSICGVDKDSYLEAVREIGLEPLIEDSYKSISGSTFNPIISDFFLEKYYPNLTTYRILLLEDFFIQYTITQTEINEGKLLSLYPLENNNLISKELTKKLFAICWDIKNKILKKSWSSMDFSTDGEMIVFHELGIGFSVEGYTRESLDIISNQLLSHIANYDYMHGI